MENENEQFELMFDANREILMRFALQTGRLPMGDPPEVTELHSLLVQFAGETVKDIFNLDSYVTEGFRIPYLMNYYCYCFAKGAEAAYIWKETGNSEIDLDYNPDDAYIGRAGALVSGEFSIIITDGMGTFASVCSEYRNEILNDPQYKVFLDPNYVENFVTCGLFWSAVIGYYFGMHEYEQL